MSGLRVESPMHQAILAGINRMVQEYHNAQIYKPAPFSPAVFRTADGIRNMWEVEKRFDWLKINLFEHPNLRDSTELRYKPGNHHSYFLAAPPIQVGIALMNHERLASSFNLSSFVRENGVSISEESIRRLPTRTSVDFSINNWAHLPAYPHFDIKFREDMTIAGIWDTIGESLPELATEIMLARLQAKAYGPVEKRDMDGMYYTGVGIHFIEIK